ncbi:TIGR02391 family protein [Shewanella frigidimarina]|uniref:TIGR02391 family protein n=1 Tax=Shewanella frigidimarina TaxID=56812 RepID=UPI003D78D57A
MSDTTLEMRFDPRTIQHLGVKMYSTLPPALSEIISNAYDADASNVKIELFENNGQPKSISIIDDGEGMSLSDIINKFLVIGRNRREDIGDVFSPRFNRLSTGKKGLGKLALFGLANKITVRTIKDKKLNVFELSWDELINTKSGSYEPHIEILDQYTENKNGTTIKLSELKRKSKFDANSLANSISRIFNIDENFSISIKVNQEPSIIVSMERRYNNLETQFIWVVEEIINENKNNITGKILTSKLPISPASGLRGITIYSRGKLVNQPEFFSDSSSSHFYQYLTGWINADFIDNLEDDVISTNRQSINWDQEDMELFRIELQELISFIGKEWRQKRKDENSLKINNQTGINTTKWFSTLKGDVRSNTEKIVNMITSDETFENIEPVVKALHALVPEYPELHWRHLAPELKDRVSTYYANSQFGEAADISTKIYCEEIRKKTGLHQDGVDLTGKAFGGSAPQICVADISTITGQNIQSGQEAMSRGLILGFRNPMAHAPIDTIIPTVFTEIDCLNILSLTSYLITRTNKK